MQRVSTLGQALERMPGVEALWADLEAQRLTLLIDGELMALDALPVVLEDLGYPVAEVLEVEEVAGTPDGS